MYPKIKYQLKLSIIETSQGKHTCHFDEEELDVTMKEIGLALYNLKKIEQKLIDREWDGQQGYEIEDENGTMEN